MLSFSCMTVVLSIGLGHLVAGAYVNDLDQRVDFKCTKGTESISRVQSIHDNDAEDRRFQFECGAIGLDTQGATPQCAWSANFENDLDKPLEFECPSNRYVSGMISEHDNGAEDRRWKFNCCGITDIHLYDCELTAWTNDFDRPQDYRVPNNWVMKGVFSEHDNGPEDRRYRYEICKVKRFTESDSIVG